MNGGGHNSSHNNHHILLPPTYTNEPNKMSGSSVALCVLSFFHLRLGVWLKLLMISPLTMEKLTFLGWLGHSL